jgi:hypothetical protein
VNRRLLLCASGVVTAAGLTAAVAVSHSNEPTVTTFNLPITYTTETDIAGFPYKESDLLQWKAEGQTANAQIRQHAWDIFRGLVLNSEKHPMWDHWHTKCDLKLESTPCDGADAKVVPTVKMKLLNNLRVPDQLLTSINIESPQRVREFETSGASQLAEVTFDPEAFNYISGVIANTHEANGDAAFTSMLTKSSSSPGHPATIGEFPPKAIAVKTVWEIVAAPNLGGAQQVFVWDPAMQKQNELPDSRLKTPTDWVSKITVDTTAKPCDDSRDYGAGELVPLSCFYWVPVTATDLNQVISTSGMKLLNPRFTSNAPYYLILVGFHVMTREIQGWTWQTFYWSQGAFGLDSAKRAGNPASSSGDLRWSHYVMDTTLSQTLPPEPNGDPKICFDPYLEGPQPFGETSNCIVCHQYAFYQKAPQQKVGYAFAQRARNKPPSSQETEGYFNTGLDVSFLWSLADANVPPGDNQNLRIMQKWLLNLEQNRKLMDQKLSK